MSESEAQLLRRQGLAFFGRILAGQTHELTNVLNVIHELTGLEADVLSAGERTGALDVDKLRRTVEKVRAQLRRGETITRSMNRFAHSVDGPVSVFDVQETLVQIIDLAERSARLTKTALDPEFPARSLSLETSLFGFQQAVFACIERALAAAAQQRRIRVGYEVRDAGVDITVSSADPIPVAAATPGTLAERACLEPLVRELGGRIAAEPTADAPHRFTLFFPTPRSHPPGSAKTPGDAGAEDTHAA
jgi:signal transduction histidine kinase